MSRYFDVLVSFGILYPLLLAVGAVECSEKETLLKPRSDKVSDVNLTNCLLECTGMTYIKKLQLQDNHNIRLQDSTEGDFGEHCWSTELKCTVGERFELAYVVLPVDLSAVGPEQLEVKATLPTAATLPAHHHPATVADSCGLRYDVTPHFSAGRAGASFCVQVDAREGVLGERVLRCPPFLVTLWQRGPEQHNREGQ
ncbi:uncharacterized protein ACO6RY_05995 [Pungitius sinensis]